MSTQLAEAELTDLATVEDVVRRSGAEFGEDNTGDERHMSAPRGIVIAMLISLPFWGLVVFTVYMLL
jgi:hypothetical protein